METFMTAQSENNVPVALISSVLLAPIAFALVTYFTITHISTIAPRNKAQVQRLAPVGQFQAATAPATQQ